jgi:nucleotide-binding universal stress UspA family protein
VKAPPASEEWSHTARRSLAALKTKALLELGRLIRFANERGVTADYRLVVGIPEDSIVKVAADGDINLIALGTHGRAGWDRFRLGSVAETIMRTASCPVLTGRAPKAAPSSQEALRFNVSRILVATDFSVSSIAALQFAVALAKQLKAKIMLLHVAEAPDSSRSTSVQMKEAFRRRTDRLFQKVISASRADPLVSESIVTPGKPVEVILDQAKRTNADLIVMGTHGRRGIKLLILGSVASSVVRKASCPVLVVKAQATKQPRASSEAWICC